MDLVTLSGSSTNASASSSASLASSSSAARLQRAQKILATLNATALDSTQATDTYSITRSADPLAIKLTAALQGIGDANETLSVAARGLGSIQSELGQMRQLTRQAQSGGISAADRQAAMVKLTRLRGQIGQVLKQAPVTQTGATLTTADITGAAASQTLDAALPAYAANTAVLDAASAHVAQVAAANPARGKTALASGIDTIRLTFGAADGSGTRAELIRGNTVLATVNGLDLSAKNTKDVTVDFGVGVQAALNKLTAGQTVNTQNQETATIGYAARGDTALDVALGSLDATNPETFKQAGAVMDSILSRVESINAQVRALKARLASQRTTAVAQYAGNVASGAGQVLNAATAQDQSSAAQTTILQQAALALSAHGNVSYLSLMSLFLTL